MTKVIYDKDLSVISRLVMVCLLLEDKDSIDISIDELAEMVNCSRKTIIKAMKELEDKKYIEKIRRGQGKNNIYNIIKGEK